jgi:hypothetical protein
VWWVEDVQHSYQASVPWFYPHIKHVTTAAAVVVAIIILIGDGRRITVT